MSETSFRGKRRQKFLTEKYFSLNLKAFEVVMTGALSALEDRRKAGDFDPFGQGGMFKDYLEILKLHYTAGEPIESLIPLYSTVMEWFVKWHEADIEYTKHLAAETGQDLRLDMSPIEFADLFHFQLAIDVVSLGVLLGQGEHLRTVAKCMASLRDKDMLFETLIEPAVTDPSQVEDFFHVEPYDRLLEAIYSIKEGQERSAKVKEYLDSWYRAFEGVPWHDGHLVQNEEYSNYAGYWSFESAAVCLIHGIDDASFRDHLLYPKDMVDWARNHGSLEKISPGASGGVEPLRLDHVEAGQPCSRDGWWITPAKVGSRRYFKAGEVMPDFGASSDYGQTIWQWDADQSAPKL